MDPLPHTGIRTSTEDGLSDESGWARSGPRRHNSTNHNYSHSTTYCPVAELCLLPIGSATGYSWGSEMTFSGG